MRRFNAILVVAIMLLFLYHAIYGSMELFGMVQGGSRLYTGASHLLLMLIALHIIIGVKLTIDTLISQKRAKVSYTKYNRLFWTRRISGFALMLFMLVHVFIFTGQHIDGQYRLREFGGFSLFTQLLMVVSLLIHLCTNITPLRIALGISDKKSLRTDVIWVLSLILLFCACAFLIYFLRWRAV